MFGPHARFFERRAPGPRGGHHLFFGPHHRERWDDGDWSRGGPGPGPRGSGSGFDFLFGRGPGGPRWGGPRERVFGKGDLKYVILDLLQEKPRHGYDIIRALEERFRGHYSPSPGTVYPTLQLLEDQGLVSGSQQDGKKVYAITDEGRRFLGERADTMDDIRDRVGAWWGRAPRAELRELMQEFGALARFMFEQGARAAWADPSKIKRIRDVVARTRHDIEAILNEPDAPAPPPPAPGPETTIV